MMKRMVFASVALLCASQTAIAQGRVGHHAKSVVNGVHHVAVSVPDIEKARWYYIGILGLEEVSSGSWSKSEQMDKIVGIPGSSGKSMMLSAGNMYVEVFEYSSPDEGDPGVPPRASRLGYTHICFDVDGVDAIVARLKAHGLAFHSEPQSLFGVTTVYSRDPFGNLVEFQHIAIEGRVRRLPSLAD